jgi:hypothetical protein
MIAAALIGLLFIATARLMTTPDAAAPAASP